MIAECRLQGCGRYFAFFMGGAVSRRRIVRSINLY